MSKISSLQKQLDQKNAEIGDLRKEVRELKEQGEDGSLYMQVDYLQQKNDALCAANAALSSANARLTEDAQRHFDARREAEKKAETFHAETAYWKARWNELREEIADNQKHLKKVLAMETHFMQERAAANAQILALQQRIDELTQRAELGRDIKKPSIVSKRFKYLEF